MNLFQEGKKTVTARKNLLLEQREILEEKRNDITKTIELCDSKDKYIMDDFFKELEHIVDKTTLNNIMNTMNNYSKIIFGKNIDINNSMEQMYQEALANIISQHIKI